MKRSLSNNGYLKKIKELVAQLASVGEFAPKSELILYVFNDVDSSYNPYICSNNNHVNEVTMEKLHSQLFSYENLIHQQSRFSNYQVIQANIFKG